jgi:hypothetical protein
LHWTVRFISLDGSLVRHTGSSHSAIHADKRGRIRTPSGNHCRQMALKSVAYRAARLMAGDRKEKLASYNRFVFQEINSSCLPSDDHNMTESNRRHKTSDPVILSNCETFRAIFTENSADHRDLLLVNIA